jgi:hypothetical protein
MEMVMIVARLRNCQDFELDAWITPAADGASQASMVLWKLAMFRHAALS